MAAGARMSREMRGGTRRRPTTAAPTDHIRTGLRMRSALEARWADCLDRAGITWTYEPEVIRLGAGAGGRWLGGYLPDFRLDGLPGTWLEVKGPHFARIEKTRELARNLGETGYVVVATAVGVAWQMLPSGGASALEVGYGACRCGLTAVGALRLGRRSGGGARGLTCRACGRGVTAQGVLGW